MAHNPNVSFSPTSATEDELSELAVEIEGTTMTWTCPRCQAKFTEDLQTDAPIYGFEVQSMGGEDEGMVDLVCECGTKHPGGEQANCGFAVRLPVKRE